MKAIYSGSFDPVTVGHMDIIERASRMFDEVVILLMRNPKKKYTFTEEDRKAMIEAAIAETGTIHNVTVVIGQGLTVDMASKLGASAIIRGIRAITDYEFELMQATANLKLNDRIETFLMIARPEYSFLSSSVVKEIAINGGEIRTFVPDAIVDHVKEVMESYIQ